MKVSELIKGLEEFKSSHGDVEVEGEYWCAECGDTHPGKGLRLELSGGTLTLSIVRLGEDMP